MSDGHWHAYGYDALSDYRIKKNVKNLDDSYTVDNIRPISYDNIVSNRKYLGVIAHELQEIYPFMVTGEKDCIGDYQSVNYNNFILILIKEVQDLKKWKFKTEGLIQEIVIENGKNKIELQSLKDDLQQIKLIMNK